MREESTKNTNLNSDIQTESSEYSDDLALDYCGFRLSSLAKKIKSEYFKFKKQNNRLMNL